MRNGKANILLIDDEPLVLEMFAYVLRECGWRVKTALSGEEGIRIFEQCRIDLLLCDIDLRTMDGFDVAAIARRKAPSLPVALITGKPNLLDMEHARRLEYEYLSKPIELPRLVEVVGRRLGRSLRESQPVAA